MAAGVVPQSSCSLKPDAPAAQLQRRARRRDTVLPLPSSATFIGQRVERLRACAPRYHAPGVTVVALVPSAGPGAAADDGGDAGGQRLVEDLRADEVHVAVDRPGGEDATLARQHLGGRADDQLGVHAVGDVGVAGLAQGHDAAVADADVGLHHAPVVEHEHVGDDEVDGGPQWPAPSTRGSPCRRRTPPRRPGRAAAHGEVLGGGDEQVGVAEADPVADRGAVQLGVALAARSSRLRRPSDCWMPGTVPRRRPGARG